MPNTPYSILVYEIGGTKVLVSRVEIDDIANVHLGYVFELKLADCDSFLSIVQGAELAAKQRGWPSEADPSRADLIVVVAAGIVRGLKVFNQRYQGGCLDIGAANVNGTWRRKPLVLNDIEGMIPGLICPAVLSSAITIKNGKKAPRGQGALWAPGTGLGVGGFVFDRVGNLVPVCSEGGNIPIGIDSFSPNVEFGTLARVNEVAIESDTGLASTLGHLRMESIISGPGLELFYSAITSEKLSAERIVERLLLNEAPNVLSAWATLAGRSARTTALMFQATGGLFIAGGVLQKSPSLILNDYFAAAFLAGPTPAHQEFLDNCPILLITERSIGLYGGALAGMQYLRL